MLLFTEGIYPETTIVEDAMGNLHLFPGRPDISEHFGKVVISGTTQEAPVFMQFEADIQAIKDCLTESQRMHLALGYDMIVRTIPHDYFNND